MPCGIEPRFPPVCVVFCLLRGVAQHLVRRLDCLKLGYAFLFLAGVAVGVVQQGELAVSLADVVDRGSRGKFEIGIVVWISISRRISRVVVGKGLLCLMSGFTMMAGRD